MNSQFLESDVFRNQELDLGQNISRTTGLVGFPSMQWLVPTERTTSGQDHGQPKAHASGKFKPSLPGLSPEKSRPEKSMNKILMLAMKGVRLACMELHVC